MEARNQRVDDLLLEIDQSIAASRHAMRSFFFLMTARIAALVKYNTIGAIPKPKTKEWMNNRNYQLALETIEAATIPHNDSWF